MESDANTTLPTAAETPAVITPAPDIAPEPPCGKRTAPGPLTGLLGFIVLMLLLLFVAAPLQHKLGLYGVALSELLILAVALVCVYLSRQRLRDVFPLERVNFAQIRGVFFTYIGTMAITMAVSMLTLYLFPSMQKVSANIQSIVTQRGFFTALLIVSLLPGLCEEAMHRGFLLTTLSGWRRTWVRVLVIGLYFGFFHLDPYRFLLTAFLGMALAYIMIKTRNFFMPVCVHMFNNLFSLSVSFIALAVRRRSVVAPTQSDTAAFLAIHPIIIVGTIIPPLAVGAFFLYLAYMRLNNKSNERRTALAILACVGVIGTGFFLMIVGAIVTRGLPGMSL